MRCEQIFTTTITAGTPASAGSTFIPTQYETRTIQATIDAVSGFSATVVVWGSNDGIGKVTLGTFALTQSANSDGIVLNAPVNWRYVGATITASAGGSASNVYVTTTSAEAYKI